MARSTDPPLSRRERQIMDVIYARGQASALEVLRDLPDPPGKTAVRTLVHTQDGQTYVYKPRHPRETAGNSAFRRVLDVFFGGSLEQAVAAHLGESAEELDENELKRLANLIQSARKARKGGPQ